MFGCRWRMYTGEGALDNRLRKQVFNYISTHPGASFGNIRSVLDINKSTLAYHLTYLERADKIESRKEGKRRCFYCKHKVFRYKEPYQNNSQHSLTKTQRRLLNLIQHRPGVTKAELTLKTKINGKKMSYNLRKLCDLKLIWQVKDDGIMGYEYITQDILRDEVFNRLVVKLLANEIDEQKFQKILRKLEAMDLDELMK